MKLTTSNWQLVAQTFLHFNEFKEVLKRTVKRTYGYVDRALEITGVVIIKNIQLISNLFTYRLNVVREV